MKRICLIFPLILLFLGAWGLFASPRHVNLVTIDGPIGPITARIIDQAIEASEEDSAEALVIELNTPGGLDESMRIITRKILNSGIPVIVYVAPSGSRAASAGVFITLSAHIAAMAPGTNMGSAHPVAIGGQMDSTMAEKVVNDAAAYMRSIANRRGRNEEWAEESVRESISATEYEALKLKVIDLVVDNVRALLDSCHGRTVELPSGEKVLDTREIEVRRAEISVRDRILQVITNPTIDPGFLCSAESSHQLRRLAFDDSGLDLVHIGGKNRESRSIDHRRNNIHGFGISPSFRIAPAIYAGVPGGDNHRGCRHGPVLLGSHRPCTQGPEAEGHHRGQGTDRRGWSCTDRTEAGGRRVHPRRNLEGGGG